MQESIEGRATALQAGLGQTFKLHVTPARQASIEMSRVQVQTKDFETNSKLRKRTDLRLFGLLVLLCK